MTSIELFRPTEPSKDIRPDWGTGTAGGTEHLQIPRAPTWQMSGMPPDQKYQLTALRLSNVRDNDELIPRPQGTDIGKRFINKPFPAEHPYASHIERFAILPKFDSPNDPKRGVAARLQQPISDEMPANAYNVTVVKKVKGFPCRHEIQTLTSEGNKEALYWHGEHYFDQQSKLHGNRLQYYPIPPKQIAPNLQDRPDELQLSEKSQNVLRNLERNQWIPSQKLDYTGLGPANPMALDNMDCKKIKFFQTRNWDDKLYQRSVNTFDPARPMEGRLRKLFAPKPPQQQIIESGLTFNPDHRRKMTVNEIQEDRLLNGREYANLPSDPCDPLKDKRWQEMDQTRRAGPSIERVQTAQEGHRENDEFEVPDNLNKVAGFKVDYLNTQKEEMHRRIQGNEAQNRWNVLELGTPGHDIAQLKEKYKILHGKEMPCTFYLHEGKYNEERAGLYKTSYDPQRLTYSMNAQQLGGGALFNTSMSHIEASQYPTIVWDENEAALKGSNTVVFKNNELSGDQPRTSDVLNPYRETVDLQRQSLQQTVASARPRIQEGEFVLRDDIYGDSYSTRKFLQENKLDRNIRIEPTDLMSQENQNLERTRERVAPYESPLKLGKLKSVHFSDNVNVQNFHHNYPIKVEHTHVKHLDTDEELELANAFGYNPNSTQTNPEQSHSLPCPPVITGDCRNLAQNFLSNVPVPMVLTRNTEPILNKRPVSFTRNPQLKPAPLSETIDAFRSLTTNVMPSGMKCEPSMNTSYSCQFPVYNLAEKNDRRFLWEPGMGNPRPQSCLLDMQDLFIKSEVHKRFHQTYPENNNPEARFNISTGKKHSFFGMNAQVIHG